MAELIYCVDDVKEASSLRPEASDRSRPAERPTLPAGCQVPPRHLTASSATLSAGS